MQSLERSLNQKSTGISKWLVIAWLIVALVGFVDSVYLTKVHYQGGQITCSLTHKCNSVLTSQYATFAGVPVSLGGVLYYIFMILGGVLYLDRKENRVMNFFAHFSSVGLLASAYFFYLQAFVLKAFCQYCLLSAMTSTILFILGMSIIFKFKRTNKDKNNDS